MNRRIVLVSFTPKDASGGVPRWNRDLIAGFPEGQVVHYSWDDFVAANPFLKNEVTSEWEKAHVLAQWLVWSKKVTKDDIVIGDGFWCASPFLDVTPRTVSVCHGNWSHTTKDDVDAGIKPEFPEHHAAQVRQRSEHLRRGRPLVAVSDFIHDQMMLQWNYPSRVVLNGVDLKMWRPRRPHCEGHNGMDAVLKVPLYDETDVPPWIVHGVTTSNKGFDHIEAVKRTLSADVIVHSLDEAVGSSFWWKDISTGQEPNTEPLPMVMDGGTFHAVGAAPLALDLAKGDAPKPLVMRSQDMAVFPSAHEGNSYFFLECLASGLPVVCYNVGLAYSLSKRVHDEGGFQACVGAIIDRKYRSPEETAKVTKFILESVLRDRSVYNSRRCAELFSVERFQSDWRRTLEELFP